MKKNEKEVSIIIPTYNEEENIGECLKSLEKQTYKNLEIILVDDGSTDNTVKIVENFKGVKLIKGEHKGPGNSRNLGSKKARGKILIFVDADMTFDKDYIKNLIKPILDDKTGKIIGTGHDYETVKNISNVWSRCWGRIRVDLRTKKIDNYGPAFRAIKKDKFLELGGFDPRYGYADDQTLYYKYGLKPLIAPNTTCYHKNPETLKAVYKQSRWIGASLNNKILNMPLIKKIIPFLMIIVSPAAISFLSIKKIIKNKEISLLGPMLVFMTARYFGIIEGIGRRVYFGQNFK